MTLNDFDGWFWDPTSAGWKLESRLPSAMTWARPLTWTLLRVGKLPPMYQPPLLSEAATLTCPLSTLGKPGWGAPVWPSRAPAPAVVGAREVNSPPT